MCWFLDQRTQRIGDVANVDIPSSTTDLGESEHNAPHFALVTKSIFANNLKFRVPGIESIQIRRHEQSKLLLQWPGNTDRRAASKAIKVISRRSDTRLLEFTYDDVAPCKSYCTSVVP